MTMTVGIPFQRWDRNMAMAVASVLMQSVEDWELILHFDGPKSELPSIPETLATDPRVRTQVSGRSRGLAFALNRIAEAASSPMLVRMDSDDVMRPNRLLRQREVLTTGLVDVVGSKAFVIDEEGILLGAYREGDLPTTCAGYLKSNAFTHPAVAGLTNWFRSNPYDERVKRAEDKELWIRTHDESRFLKISDRLLYYRIPRRLVAGKVRETHRDNVSVMKGSMCGSVSPETVAREVLKARAKFALQTAAIAIGRDLSLQRRKIAPLAAADHDSGATYLLAVQKIAGGLR